MTPDEIDRAIRAIVAGGEEIDALQILMLGPDAAEVKVRLVADGSWVQGVVQRRDWQMRPPPDRSWIKFGKGVVQIPE